MEKFIDIHCDGGLSNRLGCLFSGLHLSTLVNATPRICWDLNKWCDIALEDLYDFSIETIDIDYMQNHIDYEHFICHGCSIHAKNSSVSPEKIVDPNTEVLLYDYLDLIFNKGNIFYSDNAFQINGDTPESIAWLDKFKLKPNIVDPVVQFIKNNNIDKTSTIGVHVRGTDIGRVQKNITPTKHIYDIVANNPDNLFVVCSDEREIEEYFESLPNVVTFKKSSYVTKIDPTKGWDNNVYRSKESIIEALQDALILSQTKHILLNSGVSSFTKISEFYMKSNLFLIN